MRSIFSIAFLFFTLTIFCQNNLCANFKTGTFKYSNSKYSEWIVKRTDSIQIETNSKTGVIIHSLVEWKSDCEYTLTCKSVSKSDLENIIGKVFRVIITETFDDRYKCVSKSNDIQLEDLELEMVRIK